MPKKQKYNFTAYESEVVDILKTMIGKEAKQLYKIVSKGGSRADLIKKIEAISDQAANYASTYLDTSLSIISRKELAKLSDDWDANYYRYIGGIIKTTREFCDDRNGYAYTKKEVQSWADDEWNGKIEDTDSTNIFYLCGGWNCRHQLIPITKTLYNKYAPDDDDEEEEQETEVEEYDNNPFKQKVSDEEKKLIKDLLDMNIADLELELNTVNKLSPAGREDFIQELSTKQKGKWPDLDGEESLVDYTGTNYEGMNKLARGAFKTGDYIYTKDANRIVELDKYFNVVGTKDDVPTKLYRGTSFRTFSQYDVGDTYIDQGFMSTTSYLVQTEVFTAPSNGYDGYMFEVLNPDKDLLAINLSNQSADTGENEFLLPRKTAFEIVGEKVTDVKFAGKILKYRTWIMKLIK
jgi:hypothetical protein